MSHEKSASAGATSIYVSLRMPIELYTEAEAHRQALSQAAGGASTPFSFAVFHALRAGLDALHAGDAE